MYRLIEKDRRRRRRKALNWCIRNADDQGCENGPVRFIVKAGVLQTRIDAGSESSTLQRAPSQMQNHVPDLGPTDAELSFVEHGCRPKQDRDPGTGESRREQPIAIRIHTKGSCHPNPGRGGWAFVINRDGIRTEASGSVCHTTNNQMELRAAIEALSAIQLGSKVELFSDSQYLVRGITTWVPGWKRGFWRTADGKAVKHREVWENLERLCGLHTINWNWIRGQAGDPDNARCNYLANQQAGIASPWQAQGALRPA